MVTQRSTFETNAHKLLRTSWNEYIKNAWFVSFHRAFKLCILLTILQSFLFFSFDYLSYASGQWQESSRYQYVLVWRIAYVVGLIPFVLIGRRIKPRTSNGISTYHKAYLYWFISFLVFTGAAIALVNYGFFLGDISLYTISIVLISAIFPIPNRYREVTYIVSLLSILLGALLIQDPSSVYNVLFTNATSIVVVSLFIQNLSSKYFRDSFVAVKLSEHQNEMVLRQRKLDLKLSERQKTIESIFYFIHNGPLQTLASTIRHARNLGQVDEDLIRKLNQLNDEMRKINDSLTQEIIGDEHSYYLGDQEKVDLNLPFDELLYEVYARTLQRDFEVFKDLRLKIPSFDTCYQVELPNNIKKDICFFLEESLCNVGKHASGASRLEVTGLLKDNSYTLSITDNGTGLCSSREGEGTKRFMKIASELGGTFQRVSVEPRGTLCQLRWRIGESL